MAKMMESGSLRALKSLWDSLDHPAAEGWGVSCNWPKLWCTKFSLSFSSSPSRLIVRHHHYLGGSQEDGRREQWAERSSRRQTASCSHTICPGTDLLSCSVIPQQWPQWGLSSNPKFLSWWTLKPREITFSVILRHHLLSFCDPVPTLTVQRTNNIPCIQLDFYRLMKGQRNLLWRV